MPKGKSRNQLVCVQKKEDPVIDVLVGLPDSVLAQLDLYATQNYSTRSAAIGLLLQHVHSTEQQEKMLEQLKVVRAAHKSKNPQRRKKARALQILPLFTNEGTDIEYKVSEVSQSRS